MAAEQGSASVGYEISRLIRTLKDSAVFWRDPPPAPVPGAPRPPACRLRPRVLTSPNRGRLSRIWNRRARMPKQPSTRSRLPPSSPCFPALRLLRFAAAIITGIIPNPAPRAAPPPKKLKSSPSEGDQDLPRCGPKQLAVFEHLTSTSEPGRAGWRPHPSFPNRTRACRQPAGEAPL